MELKTYQRRVVDEVEQFLRALAGERESGNTRFGSQGAWRDCRRPGLYIPRENGLGEDLPTVCIKVPTGGGKTLLATQILGSIHRTILKNRNGAGLVLWVVPSSQIYRDTLRRLRDRKDMYRLMLEHALSRRIEVWEKHEMARLSPVRLRDCLNILVIQLASTNRETKEQLKFFRDSGGSIVDHFPPENDPAAHKALKERVPNLDMLADDPESGQHLVATSIGTLVRLCWPTVILVEGHKATSQLARSTIEGFNASVVVELSATPHRGANVVTRVTGRELLDEHMIKLPLNIATSGQKAWKDILTQARDKRTALEAKAREYIRAVGESRLIRPIVLVQVERTGRDQRGQGYLHAEDVREYLIQRLSVPATAIAAKTAEDDGLEDVDLLDPGCPVQWIITKSALQEGWDCPFAYILVSLSSTGSSQGMTQLVGRILRQPYQERTPHSELNESYVYCLHQTSTEIARQVKAALEKEGYEGDVEGIIVDATDRGRRRERTIHIQTCFSEMYTRPFEGKIYLPRFCVKEGKEYCPLDYFEHLVGRVDVEEFEYEKIDWPLVAAISEAKDRFYRVSLGVDLRQYAEVDAESLESDQQVVAWIVASLRFDYLSHKQLRQVVRGVYERLCAHESSRMARGHLALAKFIVRDKTESFIQGQIDRQTEEAFGRLFESGRVRFYLKCTECRFEIPQSITIQSTRPLVHDNGDPIARSLFDYVEYESQNSYERAVALCLDRDANVLWWYRNRVGPENFTIQGFRRHKIYPDYVVQGVSNGKAHHRVLVVESKGKHLEGNPDTTYKRQVAGYFQRAGKQVTWQQLGADFKDHVFRFQILDEAQPYGRDWRDELGALLAE